MSDWVERAIDKIGPGSNPEGVVYGIITIGALLAAESGQHDGYPDTVGSAAIALGLYWLAHAYSSLLGRRLATRERLSAMRLLRALLHDWAIVRGAAIPLLALLLAWAVGATQASAVSAALWTSVVSLVAFELLAGIRSRAGGSSIDLGELALEGAVGVAMGLSILALKVLLH